MQCLCDAYVIGILCYVMEMLCISPVQRRRLPICKINLFLFILFRTNHKILFFGGADPMCVYNCIQRSRERGPCGGEIERSGVRKGKGTYRRMVELLPLNLDLSTHDFTLPRR